VLIFLSVGPEQPLQPPRNPGQQGSVYSYRTGCVPETSIPRLPRINDDTPPSARAGTSFLNTQGPAGEAPYIPEYHDYYVHLRDDFKLQSGSQQESSSSAGVLNDDMDVESSIQPHHNISMSESLEVPRHIEDWGMWTHDAPDDAVINDLRAECQAKIHHSSLHSTVQRNDLQSWHQDPTSGLESLPHEQEPDSSLPVVYNPRGTSTDDIPDNAVITRLRAECRAKVHSSLPVHISEHRTQEPSSGVPDLRGSLPLEPEQDPSLPVVYRPMNLMETGPKHGQADRKRKRSPTALSTQPSTSPFQTTNLDSNELVQPTVPEAGPDQGMRGRPRRTCAGARSSSLTPVPSTVSSRASSQPRPDWNLAGNVGNLVDDLLACLEQIPVAARVYVKTTFLHFKNYLYYCPCPPGDISLVTIPGAPPGLKVWADGWNSFWALRMAGLPAEPPAPLLSQYVDQEKTSPLLDSLPAFLAPLVSPSVTLKTAQQLVRYQCFRGNGDGLEQVFWAIIMWGRSIPGLLELQGAIHRVTSMKCTLPS
jgi:hypothetical protein